MESVGLSLFLIIILFQGFVISQGTFYDTCSCTLTGGIDLLQRQLTRLQLEFDDLKQRSKGDLYCGENGEYPSDCTELFQTGERTTGVYFIKPSGSEQPFKVFCEMAYEGWTVFQRRFNGSVDFYRTWDEYKNGFGDLLGEHWLGNEKIHALTAQGSYILRFEMHTVDNTNIIAEYDGFDVEGESGFYRIHLGSSLSTRVPVNDAMVYHKDLKFSTWDRDKDNNPSVNCAATWKAGWWYGSCYTTNPNGRYGCQGDLECMAWGNGNPRYNVFGDKSVLKIKKK